MSQQPRPDSAIMRAVNQGRGGPLKQNGADMRDASIPDEAPASVPCLSALAWYTVGVQQRN